MSRILMFLDGLFLGGGIGVVAMFCFIVSGQESRNEEKYLNGKE